MRRCLRQWFIPHKGNGYHPHLLHTHRAIHFSSVFIGLKLILFLAAISLPATAYLAPDRLAAEEQKILSLANEIREQQGVPPLRQEERLSRSATLKSHDMAAKQYFSHDGPDGRRLPDWLQDVGYGYVMAGENLAMGVASASEIVDAWVESPTHYANIVSERYEEQGIHMVSGMNHGWPVLYVTHHFGQPISGAQVKADDTVIQSGRAVAVIHEESFLDWSALDRGTVLAAGISTRGGDIISGKITTREQIIPLSQEQSGRLVGSVYIDEKPEEFFRVMTPAEIELLSSDGTTHKETLNWRRPYIPAGSAINTYKLAQRIGPLVGSFAVSKYVYALFVLIFSVALLINIFVEIRRQHVHVIGQTLSVIVLLLSLMIV